MFTLLKGGLCFAPERLGEKDILVALGKICRIAEHIPEEQLWEVEVVDCRNKLVCPGFIDQHVHITGGGGEEGPASKIPEILLNELITAGVTTVVGLLGADGLTRTMANLLAKAKALEAEGVTTFIYTGSYGIPPITLTGKVMSDMVFVDKVIGCGEIAISDYRSSYPNLQTLKELAYEVNLGGMLGSKAGVLHIHVGDGREGLWPLWELLAQSDFSRDMFVPTHINRSRNLFTDGMEYVRQGGYIDLTAGERSKAGVAVPAAVEELVKQELDMARITISSDGNGSIPANTGTDEKVGKVKALFQDFRHCVLEKKLNPEQVLPLVTSNVARILKLFPRKGALREGSDGDILVLDQELAIEHLLAGGEFMIRNGRTVRKGWYE